MNEVKIKKSFFIIFLVLFGFINVNLLCGEYSVVLDKGRCLYFTDMEYRDSFITPDGRIGQFSGFLKESMDMLGMSKGADWLITNNGKYVFYFPGAGLDLNIFFINTAEESIIKLTKEPDTYNILDISPDYNVILFTRGSYNDEKALCYLELDTGNSGIIGYSVSQGRFINNYQIVYEQIRKIYIITLNAAVREEILCLDDPDINIGSRIGDLSDSGKLIMETSYDDTGRFPGYIDINTHEVILLIDETDIPLENSNDFRWRPGTEQLTFVTGCEGMNVLYFNDMKSIRSLAPETVLSIEQLCWLSDSTTFVYMLSNYYDPYDNGGNEGIYLVNINSLQTDKIYDHSVFTYPLMACPHLYIYDGIEYVYYCEVLGNIVYRENERTESVVIPDNFIINDTLKIRIFEELSEITYLNSINVNNEVLPQSCPQELLEEDSSYMVLGYTEYADLEFKINDWLKDIVLEVTGYYQPAR